ncbi:MAG: HAMP domain-containing sensor histidine kinase, partial [Actinomycetota bacterium]
LLEEGEESIDVVERRAMLEIVGQQAVHMSRIVSDLIMLARDAGDELELVITRVPMHDLARRSVQASGIAASSVDVDCPSDLEGFVDASRIQQVLVNLLTNAERYGGQERKLQLRARGSDLVLEVHDNGSGIPRRYEVSVWDRFERGPNRLNAEVPGSGIGLAIVEAIANAHGGTASYRESELLGGACFSVDLPGRANSTVMPATDDVTPNLRPNQPVG